MAEGGTATIMVVEDYEDSLHFLTSLLKLEGYDVMAATNGEEAVELAAGQPPDLVLMDIGLPGIDGLSAVWRMRNHPELAEVPVIIISAHDSYDLRAEAAGAGCRGYLSKPLDMEELKALVRRVLQS